MRMFAAVLTSAFLSAGTVTAAAEPAWSPEPIGWGPCIDFPDGECGTLRVPLDWDRPRGATVDLAVARHRATDPAHRIGVLLVNPGGPGTSNAEFALTTTYFSPAVLARFDLVGFDMRGTGGSEFIRCPDPTGPRPSGEPVDRAEFDAFRAYDKQLIAGCRAQNSPIFDHADTGTGARDMDAVRRALGERKISYHGISYGTLLGQQYAEQFGDHVRAMVLDSNIDHSVDLRHFMVDRAAAADDAFMAFVRWCDRTATCVLHGQDVLATWQRALAAADLQPLSRNWLRDWVFGELYGPDYDYIARLIADTAAGQPPFSAQFEYNYDSVRLATVCQDFALRIRDYRQYSALRAEELRRGPLMLGGSLGHDEAVTCMGVSGPPVNPPHRLNIPHAPTILLLNSLHDPATPYAWALDIHRQAPRNTALVTYEGAGHAVYQRSACTRAYADDYLLALTVPRPGARCPAA
ncbi:alpha/beta hydrolase [Actinophytocola sp.]|uniref:alpha/beta hydrolase n=1 Tax=Actinophytocola sp. TaxID=1872138 RepID=UPI002D4AF193|nr:alpha/beta hydrolase [Actinophytocola sp.]HYQ69109.1 alpha/beta hydrolase [Actinophytocola sp.]